MNNRIAFVAACACVLAVSCGGGSGSTPNLLGVKVIPVKGTVEGGVVEDPFDPSRVSLLKVTVMGPGVSQASRTAAFDAGTLEIPPIPYGYGRQIMVESCTGTCNPAVDGDIIARGRTVPFTLQKGDPRKDDITVFLSPMNSFSPTVDVDDPSTPTNPLQGMRIGATLTALDGGKMLIAGGGRVSGSAKTWNQQGDFEDVFADAEVFDPATGRFTAVGPMGVARAFHQAVKLADGRVVLMGGFSKDPTGAIKLTSSVEIFDPDSGQFRPSTGADGNPATLSAARALFTADLADPNLRMIFLAGGVTEPAAASAYWDLYIPDKGTVGHAALKGPRWNHTMTQVSAYGKGDGSDGRKAFVLIGGENADSGTATVSTVETYTVTGVQALCDDGAVAEIPGGGRTLHASVYVPQQGIIYIIGGFAKRNPYKDVLNRVDVFREGLRGFHLNAEGQPDEFLYLGTGRAAFTATLLEANTIFISGGVDDAMNVSNGTELIMEDVECPEGGACHFAIHVYPDRTPLMDPPRAGHLAAFDSTRRLFIVGGFSQGQPVTAATASVIYNPN